MASRVRWLPLIVSGAWNPALRVDAHGNSGVYALRRRDTGAVEYVGESHTGRLWKTLQRHFQKGQGAFGAVREWVRSSPAPYDAALWVTSRGARAKQHGDQRALDMQARQIARLKPSDNVDDGKANDADRCPHGTTSRKCIEAHRLPPEAAGASKASSDPDTDFAFGALAPSSEDEGDPWGGLLKENPAPRWETKLRFAKRTGTGRSGGYPTHTLDPTDERRTLCGLSLDGDSQRWTAGTDPRGARGRESARTGHRWGVAGATKACATCEEQREHAEHARELVKRAKGARVGGHMQILLGSTRSPVLLRRMRALGWGRLFAAETPKPAKGEPWALDNGVFAAWKDGAPWTDTAFLSALHKAERGISVGKLARPLFCVLPDRVADPGSLAFSLEWLDAKGRLFDVPWFLVLQNGMRPADVRAALRAHRQIAGVFLGGDDDFKRSAAAWCELAHGEGRRFHFARVSTVERLREAHAIGADSCDTSQPLWSEEAFDRFEAAALELGDAKPRARRPPGFGDVERSGQVRLCNPPARAPRMVVDVAPERRAENRTPDLFTGRTKLEDASGKARRDWKGEAERLGRELAACRSSAASSASSNSAPVVPSTPPPPPRPEGFGELDERGQASMFRRNPDAPPARDLDPLAVKQAAHWGPPFKVKKEDEGWTVRARFGGRYYGASDQTARLVVFENATDASGAALARWLVKAIKVIDARDNEASRGGASWLHPSPTAPSSEVAAWWLDLVSRMPPVELAEFARPWYGTKGPSGRTSKMTGDLEATQTSDRYRYEWIGSTADRDVGETIAHLAELTDLAVAWKALGRSRTERRALDLAQAEGASPRSRALFLRLAGWLRDASGDPTAARVASERTAKKEKAAREATEAETREEEAAYEAAWRQALEASPTSSVVGPNDLGGGLFAVHVLEPNGDRIATASGPTKAVALRRLVDELFDVKIRQGAKRRAFRGKAAAQFKKPPPARPAPPPPRPEGFGAEEAGKGRAKKGAGQLRLFNPGGLKPGDLVELGLMTFVAWLDASGRRRVRRWGLRSAPILAYDREGRLSVVYGDRPAGKATAEGAASYKRTHWGQRGQGERVAGSRLEGAAKTLGTAVEVIYTTRKGIDAEPVDYWHVFGEGARGAWKPPTLVHDPKLAGDPLAFRGGSYRVTERGIVG